MSSAWILAIEGKERECSLDVAALLGVLKIQTEMMTWLEECRTCRIGIETREIDDAVLTHQAQVCGILIGVGYKTSCKDRRNSCCKCDCNCS